MYHREMSTRQLSSAEIHALREKHYNAQVVHLDRLSEDLLILRTRQDQGKLDFRPGQYTVLGLGYWEPRLPDTQDEQLDEHDVEHLAKRAYSISCPLIDEQDRLIRTGEMDTLEFYVSLVRTSQQRPPALTPRLFLLQAGDRLLVGPHAHGHYGLADVDPHDRIVFAATGTGEAPHNAMLAELLSRGHRGPIASITCVRCRQDLGYLQRHRRLESLFENYHYVSLTTREPENLDPARPDYVGKQYVQQYLQSGRLASETGIELDPARTHVFLCGNPDMIGVPHHTHDESRRYPSPGGMIEVLEQLGFQIDQPHHRGNIHFERYW